MLPPFLNRFLSFQSPPPLSLFLLPAIHSRPLLSVTRFKKNIGEWYIYFPLCSCLSLSGFLTLSCFTFSLSSHLYSRFNLFPSLSCVSQPPCSFTFYFSDASVSFSFLSVPPSDSYYNLSISSLIYLCLPGVQLALITWDVHVNPLLFSTD